MGVHSAQFVYFDNFSNINRWVLGKDTLRKNYCYKIPLFIDL